MTINYTLDYSIEKKEKKPLKPERPKKGLSDKERAKERVKYSAYYSQPKTPY